MSAPYINSSDDTSDSGHINNDMIGICEDLSKLLKDHKYHEILTIIPTLSKFEYLPSSARLIISLTLLKLGRRLPALREIALSIESCMDRQEKENLIKYLINMFKDLGLYDRAEIAYNEAIELAKIELKLCGLNEERKNKILNRITAYKNELKLCATKYENSNDNQNLINYTPIHLQAKLYMKYDGRLNDYSLGRTCILTKKLGDGASEALLSWHANSKKILEVDPLYNIFIALKYFGPLYVYDSVIQNEHLLLRYINDEIDKHPEISYDVDPKSLVKQLLRWNRKNSNKTLYSLCAMIIKHNITLGFISYVKCDYLNASSTFKWTLKFMTHLKKSINFLSNSNEYLSSSTEKIVTLYLCQCCNLSSEDCSNNVLSALLCTLVSIEDMNITTEYLCGRLCVYFISCGFIFERMAINEKTIIKIQNDQECTLAICERYNREHLREMIRKYIIASTLKAHDDPTTLYIYDRILWGLLLYGGIHLKCFWFFNLFRNHLVVENGYGPLVVNALDRYFIFGDEEPLSRYENGWEVVNKICDIWNNLGEEDQSFAWNLDNGSSFLIPQAFHNENRLILADLFYDEGSSYVSKLFMFVSNFQIKPTLKGHIKIPTKIIQENIEFSKELVYIWSDSYMKYHGNVPDSISSFIQNFE